MGATTAEYPVEEEMFFPSSEEVDSFVRTLLDSADDCVANRPGQCEGKSRIEVAMTILKTLYVPVFYSQGIFSVRERIVVPRHGLSLPERETLYRYAVRDMLMRRICDLA